MPAVPGYGPETIAGNGRLQGWGSIRLEDRKLIMENPKDRFIWDIPFFRSGYYDADLNLNYPSENDTALAIHLCLPFRKLITSAGQVVFMEHFKRLPLGPYHQSLNVNNGGELVLFSEDRQNYDLRLTIPQVKTITYEIGEDFLRLKAVLPSDKPITLEVLPQGSLPSSLTPHSFPRVSFIPDFLVTHELTNKSISAGKLATELMQMGIYWYDDVMAMGEWGLGAVETHHLDHPRSWYLGRLREKLLKYMGNIGYDRFGHFGLLFAWEQYPDYGRGGLMTFRKIMLAGICVLFIWDRNGFSK